MPRRKKNYACHVCGGPDCDRAVYLAHGNGGAYSVAPAHKRCVLAAGELAQSWNEFLGWYVRGNEPKLKEVSSYYEKYWGQLPVKELKPVKPVPKYYTFEFTARECRELCKALEWASVTGTVVEHRAYRLWVTLDSTAQLENK